MTAKSCLASMLKFIIYTMTIWRSIWQYQHLTKNKAHQEKPEKFHVCKFSNRQQNNMITNKWWQNNLPLSDVLELCDAEDLFIYRGEFDDCVVTGLLPWHRSVLCLLTVLCRSLYLSLLLIDFSWTKQFMSYNNLIKRIKSKYLAKN